MRKPPYAGAAISDAAANCVGYKAYTPITAAVQVSRPSKILTVTKARARCALHHYDLDTWYAGPHGSPMPQPDEYGLALATCSSAEVLWPGGGS